MEFSTEHSIEGSMESSTEGSVEGLIKSWMESFIQDSIDSSMKGLTNVKLKVRYDGCICHNYKRYDSEIGHGMPICRSCLY